MQHRYSTEFKESIIKKMMPPNPISVSQLVKETGVSDVTLYKWRKDYSNQGIAVPANPNNSERWTAEDKLAVVIETASLNEAQLSEYCRSKGLYPEQVNEWKTFALTGYQNSHQMKKKKTLNQQQDKKKIKQLEAELRRKEKALAETAALLVLSKKCQAIWGESEED
ncbi:MAG: transposase [Gammaproteobacteria bacterium]|jgi:transposase-like protein|nr:transposase [Gammaproteobacteria bacterium]